MPRTIHTETTVYKFDELSDDAKQTAVERLYDINVDYDWWEYTHIDAEEIGCKISGFDTGRGGTCGLVCKDACRTARLILANHGDECDTYKLAKKYANDHGKIMEEADKDEEGELTDEYAVDTLLDELDAEFERSLGEEYLSLLRQEYEYLTSHEAIIDTITANDYEFTEDGRIF